MAGSFFASNLCRGLLCTRPYQHSIPSPDTAGPQWADVGAERILIDIYREKNTEDKIQWSKERALFRSTYIEVIKGPANT